MKKFYNYIYYIYNIYNCKLLNSGKSNEHTLLFVRSLFGYQDPLTLFNYYKLIL